MRLSIISESATPDTLVARRAKLLPSLARIMDDDSVRAVLETDDDDTRQLALEWFNRCIYAYRLLLKRPKINLYRHMYVEDFDDFTTALEAGKTGLGIYWSYSHAIESPTWKENQVGDIEVLIQGQIDVHQVDFAATLEQNFEWPHEDELIFSGDVHVVGIENRDTGQTYQPQRPTYPVSR